MACACRDNRNINCQLFVYALSSALLARRDTRHVAIPSHTEMMPESYCDNAVVKQAHKMAHMPAMNGGGSGAQVPVQKIMIGQNVSGSGSNAEQRLWYFREDILVNSHHFHWHVVFPGCTPVDPTAPGYRDRRGELFYYMHHSLIARYDTERLCNGLARVRKFDFSNLVIEEGYFGKLSSENSSAQHGTRQANTQLANVNSKLPPFQFRLEELIRWRDRTMETIDLGFFVRMDRRTGKESREKLDNFTGIDVLGNIIENSQSLCPHPQYYGPLGLHNMGHVLIAASNDPRSKHNEGFGVMGDVSTAMRDPAFYRWHRYIDHMFDLYKQTLPPYPLDSSNKMDFPLRWKGVEVVPNSFYVRVKDGQERNMLRTFWDTKDVDLSRGLDFRRGASSEMDRKPVMGVFLHLTHAPFEYNLKIQNNTGRPTKGTVRIFMAPKTDEHNAAFVFRDQRLLFFEMDKTSVNLKQGVNDIKIESSRSSITLRDEGGSSFRRLEQLYVNAQGRDDVVNESQCSCGWPQHLLLPRGSAGGTDYDLFVIVTDGGVDQVPDNLNRENRCDSAFSFCGVLNSKYPDARPMGYPFDRLSYRKPLAPEMRADIFNDCPEDDREVENLAEYASDIKNSTSIVVKIFHDNSMRKDAAAMQEQLMTPDGGCTRLNEMYGTGRGGGGAGSGGGQQGGNLRPSNPPPSNNNNGRGQNRPPPSSMGQQQQASWGQWSGVGGGRKPYGRSGRQSDGDDYEDWEDLTGTGRYD